MAKQYYTEFQTQLAEKNRNFTVATIFSYSPNEGGINVNNLGITKMTSLSTTSKWVYNGKKSSVIGISIGGVSIGYTVEIIDRMTLNANGTSSVLWNI
jgi:hypothetical protein